MKKKFFLVIICFSAIFSLAEIRYLLSSGFLVKKVLFDGYFNGDYDFPNTYPKGFFDQTFTYLGKGRQCYVFESADRRYVLKFVRFHKYRVPLWLEVMKTIGMVSCSQKILLDAKENRYHRTMNSYRLAYHKLSDISKVEYVHLNPTEDLNKIIALKDKSGKKIFLEADRVAFIVQRKAEDLATVINELIKNGDSKKIEKLINSFFNTMALKRERNIINRDFPNMLRNSGCIDGHFVEVDIGSFKEVDFDQNTNFNELHLNFIYTFYDFFKEKAPSYVPLFENRLKKELICLK